MLEEFPVCSCRFFEVAQFEWHSSNNFVLVVDNAYSQSEELVSLTKVDASLLLHPGKVDSELDVFSTHSLVKEVVVGSFVDDVVDFDALELIEGLLDQELDFHDEITPEEENHEERKKPTDL